MQRYLIITMAILAGLLVLVLLSKMAGRHMRGEAIMPFRYLIAGAVMIAVMVAGGIWLETGSGSPDQWPINRHKLSMVKFCQANLTKSNRWIMPA